MQRIKGSIGYVEYAYAKRNKMSARRGAEQGRPVRAARRRRVPGRRRVRRLEDAPGFYQILTEQPGKTSWPITGASFILMHAKQDKPQNAAEVLKFFDWALKNGQKMADGARLRADAGRAWSR